MPVELVRKRRVEGDYCPTCQTWQEVVVPEGKDIVRFSCLHCTQWITAEISEKGVEFTTKDAEYIPKRTDEQCPNEGCPAVWELWFNPKNGALLRSYGATYLGTGNMVKCQKCGSTAKVSLK